MAQSHLNEVLKAAGLPEDQIKAITELPDDAKDFKPDTYIVPINSAQEARIKNDPKFYEGLNKDNLPAEFYEKLRAEGYGVSAKFVRHHMLKSVGLTEDDFADLGENFKKMEVFTPEFVKRISAGKVGDKELQAKLMEANAELERIKAEAPNIETKFKTDYEAKITDFTIKNDVIGALSAIPGLKAPAKYLTDNVVAKLKSQYGFEIVGDNAEIRQKEKPTLKVLTDNGTKELTLAQAVLKIVESDDLVDKKVTTKGQVITTKVTPEGGKGLVISQNVNDKIAKRIAEDQKAG